MRDIVILSIVTFKSCKSKTAKIQQSWKLAPKARIETNILAKNFDSKTVSQCNMKSDI